MLQPGPLFTTAAERLHQYIQRVQRTLDVLDFSSLGSFSYFEGIFFVTELGLCFVGFTLFYGGVLLSRLCRFLALVRISALRGSTLLV